MSIIASGITKTFGQFKALNDVDLVVPSGKLIALLGPSGSGKTTLLRIIAGLEFADEGSGLIEFHGEDVSRVSAGRRGVGFVFQHYALFRHMTVFENMNWLRNIMKELIAFASFLSLMRDNHNRTSWLMENQFIDDDRSYLVQIVDDDKILRQMLSMGMSKAGFFTAESQNGHDAINDFQSLMPDVILLDVIMPDMDGFEVCARIRQIPGGERVPIIMVTGQDDYQSITQAFNCGATDFVVKPINPLLLSYKIRYIIRANQAITDLTIRDLLLASAQEIAHLTNWEWRLNDNTLVGGTGCADWWGSRG